MAQEVQLFKKVELLLLSQLQFDGDRALVTNIDLVQISPTATAASHMTVAQMMVLTAVVVVSLSMIVRHHQLQNK